MSAKEISTLMGFSLYAIICASSLACTSAPQPPPQESKAATPETHTEVQAAASPISVPSLPAPSEQVATKESVKPPPPNPDEIKEAVGRVFEKAATPDTAGSPESFAVGDFNGDGSEDLAIIVKPSEGSLSDINSEVANWTLEEPASIAVPVPGPGLRRPTVPNKPVQAEKGKALLAIIHGVGPRGWRNSEAKQSYLLKNGAGTKMTVQTVTELRAAKDKRKLPPFRGDAIQETIGGKRGLLFWTGTRYAWFTGQPRSEAEIH